MNLFYCPEPNNREIIFLSKEESEHCVRVLRKKKEDAIFIADGKGMFYEGKIVSAHAKKCSVKIIRSIPDIAKRNYHLTIAIAPTKNIIRFEWFLEKVTEIGCDEIMPLTCRYSERNVIKTERLNKVIVSAMKQCLKSQLPKLHEITDFKKFIENSVRVSNPDRVQKFIGHIPELSVSEFPPENPQGKLLSKSLITDINSKIIICIGPEGGFSEEEVALAMQNNFSMFSLGNSRLRVETAGIVCCSIVNMMNSY